MAENKKVVVRKDNKMAAATGAETVEIIMETSNPQDEI